MGFCCEGLRPARPRPIRRRARRHAAPRQFASRFVPGDRRHAPAPVFAGHTPHLVGPQHGRLGGGAHAGRRLAPGRCGGVVVAGLGRVSQFFSESAAGQPAPRAAAPAGGQRPENRVRVTRPRCGESLQGRSAGAPAHLSRFGRLDFGERSENPGRCCQVGSTHLAALRRPGPLGQCPGQRRLCSGRTRRHAAGRVL